MSEELLGVVSAPSNDRFSILGTACWWEVWEAAFVDKLLTGTLSSFPLMDMVISPRLSIIR